MENNHQSIKRFKLYKSGKLWLVACLATLSTSGMLLHSQVKAQAADSQPAATISQTTTQIATSTQSASLNTSASVSTASQANTASAVATSGTATSATSVTSTTAQPVERAVKPFKESAATSAATTASAKSTTTPINSTAPVSASITNTVTSTATAPESTTSATSADNSIATVSPKVNAASVAEKVTNTSDTVASVKPATTTQTKETSGATKATTVTTSKPKVMVKAARLMKTQNVANNNTNTPEAQFLNQIKTGAERGWYDYGILPSVTAAQAIVESGWGQSQLATTGHNLFGIKGSYQGQSIAFPTQEWNGSRYITINDSFRQYASWSDNVYDHGSFLNENSRYTNLRGVTDANTVAQLIRSDGYATAPTYTTTLLAVIRDNNLTAWDKEVTYTNWQNKTGNYKFTKATKIYNVPSTKGTVEGTYEAGESVLYNGEVNDNGNIWLRYLANSGALHYVQVAVGIPSSNPTKPNQPTKNDPPKTVITNVDGRYTFANNTAILTAASRTANQVGTYETGETVAYNAKVTIGSQTWLRYLSYSGQQHYVLLPTTTKTTTAKITNTTGTYRFTQNTPVRQATNTRATQVATYYQGDTVNYNAKITVGSQTWLRYTSYNGASRYVLLPTNTQPVTPVSQSVITKATGLYTFSQSTAIRNAAANNSQQVGTYYAGDSVSYNAKVIVGHETWLRYTSNSGAQHYVKVTDTTKPVVAQSANTTQPTGWHTFNTTTNIRTAPTTSSKTVGQYYAGEKVFYVGAIQANGYTWLKYLSAGGAYHYVAKF